MRRLTDNEIRLYSHIGEATLRRARLADGIKIPRFEGLTLGRFIFVKPRIEPNEPSALLAHELVHAQQFAELGVIGFVSRYLSQFARHLKQEKSWMKAYRQIDLECDARQRCDYWTNECRP